MKIMKLLASCAMVGALTAVCASGAFAEVTGTITDISYTAEDATAGTSATVTFNIDNYNVAGGDYTVLVLNKNVDGSVISDDIVQIDQLTNTTTATNKTMSVSLVLPDDINNSEKKSADGTYYVRVGGAAPTEDNANGYIATTFKVGEEPAGRTKGDVVGTTAGEINLDDIVAVKQISVSYGTWDADQLKAADVVGATEGEVNLDDVIAVMQKSVGMDVTFKN